MAQQEPALARQAAKAARKQRENDIEEAALQELNSKRIQARAALSSSKALRRKRARLRAGTEDEVSLSFPLNLGALFIQ